MDLKNGSEQNGFKEWIGAGWIPKPPLIQQSGILPLK